MTFAAPYRNKYPLSWYSGLAANERATHFAPGMWGFCCVADKEDLELGLTGVHGKPVQEGEIMGHAWWLRSSPTPDTDPWIHGHHASVGDAFERLLMRCTNLYKQYIYPNPAFSQENVAAFRHAVMTSDVFKTLKTEKVPHWYLTTLVVTPGCQGRGVGRELMKWGLERAVEEADSAEFNSSTDRTNEVDLKSTKSGFPPVLTLIATPKGRWLYEKLGFRVVRAYDPAEEVTIFPGVTPNVAMVWDPTGRWLDNEKEVVFDHGGYKNGLRWKIVEQVEKISDITNDDALQTDTNIAAPTG